MPLSPERARPAVRVAVIDSGVHAGHPHIARVAGGVSIAPDGAIDGSSFTDRLGHGTAVMAAIQEKAPDAEYFAVRVFHSSLRSTARALFCAIEWAIEERMDLVNLSLGTRNAAHAEPFLRLLSRAAANSATLVAAREADGEPCFPGSLPGVLGVELDEDCDRGRYRVQGAGDGVAFAASGYPRPVPGVPPERNLQGISFAVANLTGFAARTLAGLEVRSAERLRAALIAGAEGKDTQ